MNSPEFDPAAVLRDRAVQRRQATEKSILVRKQRKAVRQLIVSKQLDGFAVIEGSLKDPELAEQVEPIVVGFKLVPLLRSIPGIGPARAQEILTVFRASPRTKLGALSWERRKQLAALAKIAATG